MDKKIFDKLNLLSLNETLVEELLNVFGPNFSLKQHYNSFTEFKTHLQAICRSYKVQLIFILSKDHENVAGLYQPNPAIITITLPKNKEISAQEILSVIFYEYVHYMRENKIPGKFNLTSTNLTDYTTPVELRTLKNQYGYYGIFLEKDLADEKMFQMLKNIGHNLMKDQILLSILLMIYILIPLHLVLVRLME